MLENLMSHRLRRYGVLFLAGIVAVVGVRLIVSLIISAGGGTEPLYESSAHHSDRLSSATSADLWVAVWNPEGPEGPLAVFVEWYGAADPLAPVNKTPRQIGLRGVHVVAGNSGGTCCPNAVTTTHCTNLLPVVYGEPSSPLSCEYFQEDHQFVGLVYANLTNFRTGASTRYECWRNDIHSTTAMSVFACEVADLP